MSESCKTLRRWCGVFLSRCCRDSSLKKKWCNGLKVTAQAMEVLDMENQTFGGKTLPSFCKKKNHLPWSQFRLAGFSDLGMLRFFEVSGRILWNDDAIFLPTVSSLWPCVDHVYAHQKMFTYITFQSNVAGWKSHQCICLDSVFSIGTKKAKISSHRKATRCQSNSKEKGMPLRCWTKGQPFGFGQFKGYLNIPKFRKNLNSPIRPWKGKT